jgi:hypothetical protein
MESAAYPDTDRRLLVLAQACQIGLTGADFGSFRRLAGECRD